MHLSRRDLTLAVNWCNAHRNRRKVAMKQLLRGLVACALVGFIQAGCSSSGQMATASSSEPAPTVNPDLRVDVSLASQGESVYTRQGCYMCHRIGDGRAAGPDLFGVTERRTVEWLTNFLKSTSSMLGSDPIAQALLEEYNHQRMPDFTFTDQQIQSLIHYLQDSTNRKRSGEDQ
jgi:mono/diheme cytochrome c family protein